MAQLNFEGDIENLSELQLKFVNRALFELGYNDRTVIVEPVGKKGDNYIANVKRFKVGKSDGTTFNMIAKIAPSNEESRTMLNTVIYFSNEIVMYQKVIPEFIKIQKSAGIPETERVRFPKCYGILADAPHEIILLEDMTETGYAMLNRFETLKNEAMLVALKNLAAFHALSYALKKSDINSYLNLKGNFINLWTAMDTNRDFRMFFESLENQTKSLMSEEKYKIAMTGNLSQVTVISKKLSTYEDESKYSVIIHGDCWTNNILFRMEDTKVLGNMMIDYQQTRESNPAADFLNMTFNCSNQATRSKHFHEWINYYHEQLERSLDDFGLQANLIFPKDQLQADLRRYGKLFVGFSVMMSFILVIEYKDEVDVKETGGVEENVTMTVVDKMNIKNLDATTVLKLKDRVIGIIDSGFEFGLI